MAKVKLTKGELKKQRDALRQYQRYLPTLQLKKQQLQVEILRQTALLSERDRALQEKKSAAGAWSALLAEAPQATFKGLSRRTTVRGTRNIAGVDIPEFVRVEFEAITYDLFTTPLWVDHAIEALKTIIALREERAILQHGVDALRTELHVTAQRVNLFEKVKIPEAEEDIRLIKIYIGDQMANAVGRSKMAKRKIEEYARMEQMA
ncbi:MAG: V-type ATP synthase subunit D [Candidatus Omnitrophota bacterium]|nr:V-type ATP synthase subunit D [Candidatus Omnitrophota bacterium]